MRIKTFFANSMAEALQEVKAQLGADALILSTKEIPRRSRSGSASSGVQVVAASDDRRSSDLQPVHPRSDSASSDESDGENTVDGDAWTYSRSSLAKAAAADLDSPNHAAAKTEQTARTPFVPEAPFMNGSAAGLYLDLISSGVHEWLAYKLVGDAQQLLAGSEDPDRAALLQGVRAVAQGLILPPLSKDGLPARKVVVFVGPTGVGKTTCTAKLAAFLALQKQKKVVLMTMDGYRIGAVEQLRTYAGLMGIPFRFVRHVAELPQAIEEHRKRDYILLDTVGRSPKDLGPMSELADFLKGSNQADVHLVLSATTKTTDMNEVVNRFETCKPGHLLFTKLDETSSSGCILNELVRSRKPLSYYSDGQRVPEDLHIALQERIMDVVLNAN